MRYEGERQDEWQEVEGILLVWDAPKELVGEYRGSVEQDGKFGKQEKHTVLADDGRTVSFFAPTVLSRLLENVQSGQRIKIVYPGTKTKSKSGQEVKEFRLFVQRKPEPEEEVPF